MPEDRIVERYHRALGFLMEAIRCSSRAYVLDHSGENQAHTLLAEIAEGRSLRLEVEEIPDWFRRAVVDKIRA